MSNENPTSPEVTSAWYCITGCLWCEAGDIMGEEDSLIVAETAEGRRKAFDLMIQRCESKYDHNRELLAELAEENPGGYDDDMGSYRWYVFGFEFPRSLFPVADPSQVAAVIKMSGRSLIEGLAPFAVNYQASDGDWSPSQDELWEVSGLSEYRPSLRNLDNDLASAVDAFRQRATR